jgi:hypothetical protein
MQTAQADKIPTITPMSSRSPPIMISNIFIKMHYEYKGLYAKRREALIDNL